MKEGTHEIKQRKKNGNKKRAANWILNEYVHFANLIYGAVVFADASECKIEKFMRQKLNCVWEKRTREALKTGCTDQLIHSE